MIPLSDIFRRAEKLVIDNSPLLLTAVGVTGVIATAVLTGDATLKAAQLITNEQFPLDVTQPTVELDAKERIALCWKLYIPAATTGAFTIAAIVGSNRIGTRRAAGLAAAYSLSEKLAQEYKDKVVSTIGAKQEEAIRADIAQDRVTKNPPSEVIFIATGNVLCHDQYSGRYFQSDREAIRAAVNNVNAKVLNSYYASLTDFYNELGLESTAASEEVGWNSDRLLEVQFTTAMDPDGRPCLSLGFRVDPIRGYYRVQ